MKSFKFRFVLIIPFCLILLFSAGRLIESADHADAPLLGTVSRNDARITDLFAFRDKNDLIVALCADPTVPPGVRNYKFQDDVTFTINIDNSTRVSYDDQTVNETFGGRVVSPEDINADLKFTITFNNGQANLETNATQGSRKKVELFTGLRDDPFIRGPRIGRNVAAMVLKVPLNMVKRSQSELLIWADSFVPETNGVQGDLAGRALRSMFPENDQFNNLPPNQHGASPDVIIYDISRPAVFPNGRSLTDDVVDLIGDSRVLGNDAPFPTANDVPFLNQFPYLAPPQ